MRATAVALVLIVAAAVVLWFSNTLNSWVLGGLIGGLAALLLSIPISLALFSYLSGRQDERLKAEEQEQKEAALSQSYNYTGEFIEEEVYEADAYVLSSEQAEYEEMRGRRMQLIQEPIASSSYPQLPAAGQSQASASARSLAQQRSIMYPPNPRQAAQSQALPSMRGKGAPVQRASANDRTHYPGFPGYQANSMRARQQTAALRAAQREAAQQYNGVEVLPTSTSQLKRLSAVRPSQSLAEQPARPPVPRPSRQLPQQQMTDQYPRRRVVDTTLAQRTGMGHRLPSGGESSANRTGSTDALRTRQPDPQTDQLRGSSPQTGQMRRQIQTPQTGQIVRNSQQQTGQMERNPQLPEKRRNPDVITGSLKNPLLRRAPYMYEDDPLRQELAQQINAPAVRRSSRLLEED
jgi:hypothetical protein